VLIIRFSWLGFPISWYNQPFSTLSQLTDLTCSAQLFRHWVVLIFLGYTSAPVAGGLISGLPAFVSGQRIKPSARWPCNYRRTWALKPAALIASALGCGLIGRDRNSQFKTRLVVLLQSSRDGCGFASQVVVGIVNAPKNISVVVCLELFSALPVTIKQFADIGGFPRNSSLKVPEHSW